MIAFSRGALSSSANTLWRQRHLIVQLIRRDVVGRYRGSWLGMFWSLFNPLLSLAVYTFAFGVVFRTKWTANQSEGLLEFAVMLFAGLIVFAIFAECVNRAPGIVLASPNFVKKIVFPLEVLPLMLLGSALFHSVASLMILILGIALAYGTFNWTVVFFPLVILPVALLCLGLGWILASLGVFVRDIGQVIGVLTSALLFLTPIFFPLSALPAGIRKWVALNPLAFPIEQARQVLVLGHLPDWSGVFLYSAGALMIAVLGYWWFLRTKHAFADVI